MPLVVALLMAGEFRVGSDLVGRPGEDEHDDRARACAADLVVEIVPLGCRDEPDNQPDNQDYRPNSHDGLSFLAAFHRGEEGAGTVAELGGSAADRPCS